MNILNFGSCNIDYVYTLDHIVRPGETERTNLLEIFPGGKGLNQSIAAARAGGMVYHAGAIGVDGGFLQNLLAETGVDVSHMKKTDGKNGHAVIQVSANGENSIFLYPGSNETLTESYIDTVLSVFSPGDMVILQNEVNAVDYIVNSAFSRGMSVVLNPSPCNEKIKTINLNKIRYLILNEVEAADITGCDEPEACIDWLIAKYPELTVVLTLGKQGCILADRAGKHYQEAFPVTTVDTTAAGDTFMGYFVASIAKGETASYALQLASAAAALAVTQKGAAPSIPDLPQVLNFLNV